MTLNGEKGGEGWGYNDIVEGQYKYLHLSNSTMLPIAFKGRSKTFYIMRETCRL